MAKITFIVPIEELHGKIAKGFGAARRSEANNEGKREPYTVHYGKRNSAVSTTEQAQRTKFGAICKLARLRAQDDTKKAADAAGFKAQSVYKTLKAYRWHKAEQEYTTLQTQG